MLRLLFIALGAIILAAVIAVLSLQAPTCWQAGETVRTPDARFENLQDYPFSPNSVESLGYRVDYVDEGPEDGEIILLMMGD